MSAGFLELLAQRPHSAWRYKLAGRDAGTLFTHEPKTRDETIGILERRFPGVPLQYLRPGGES